MTDESNRTRAPAIEAPAETPPLDRRTFLKTAAAAGAGLAAGGMGASAHAADDDPAARNRDVEAPAAKKARPLPGDIVIGRPGSDFMVDVIKTLNFDYVSANPGSSFRSLHESIVNYGGNRKPELLTCMHEESSVSIAHGYAKAAGKPMMVMAHGTVGLQHAAMGLYNAWCDRVPIFVVAGNGLDATKRRLGTEWYHSVQDAASVVRDFVKWDDAPGSLQHFAESAIRAYRVATTPPMEPVLLMADMELQENPIENPDELSIPKLTAARFPQGDAGAVGEAAKWLVSAKAPVIIADRAVRSQEGVMRLVELAESLGAPVIDLGSRMNFPSRHALCHSDDRRNLVRGADVVLLLEVADPYGQFNSVSDPHKQHRLIAKKDVKIISISMADAYIRANYQDFQRFMPVDLSIIADVESTLPVLIEHVRRASSADQRNGFVTRTQKLGDGQRKLIAQAKDAAAVGWDAVPISTSRLAMETWNAIKDEPWSLAHSDRITWARRLWPTTHYHQMLGGSGGQGVGYGVGGSLGVALANRDKGLFTVTFQPDGDLMYAPGVLWTAAHHKIPILYVMHNNRAYHQEVMHLQRMAALHDRRPDQAWIGNAITDPNIDFAMLAKAHGMWSEGPITDPAALGPALKRAVAVVKSGAPALLDVVCQPR
ncbi:MAG: thiamine pyrophosphate-binding protein [Pseudomonadota bacterium]|nr:thiamine pyrophosphate-binding protein [Pseudomonadota bacterium]